MGWIGNAPSQGLFNGGQIVDGTVDTVDLKDSAVTASKLSSTAIKDKLATDQFLAVPRGTTAQRPVSPEIGYTRYNTDLGGLENFTEEGWLKVSVPIPTLNVISGVIYSGLTSTLVLTGTQFGSSLGTVRFTTSTVTKDVAVTPSSATSASVSVPSEIFNLAANTNVDIKFINSDGGQSGILSKVSVGIPSGGTIAIVNGYRVHTFLSSSSLVVPSNFTATAQALIVAGGGGSGGRHSGGGGGGGMLQPTGLSLTANTYTVTVGAGGTGGVNSGGVGSSGSNSSFNGNTAIGGGHGGVYGDNLGGAVISAASGGSGGGAPYLGSAGSGTSGQGNAGGASVSGVQGGGGGGAGAAGSAGNSTGGAGGAGLLSTIDGNNYYYAGGGGGSAWDVGTGGAGGIGGGGGGGAADFDTSGGVSIGYGGGSARNTGGNGTFGTVNGTTSGGSGGANTGGGGGGAGQGSWSGMTGIGGNGGSGIVIIRYPLPT